MIPPIRLLLPPVIEFGLGKLDTLWRHVEGSQRVFVLCDLSLLPFGQRLSTEAESKGLAVRLSTDVVPEPPFEALETVLQQARLFKPQAVVGIGGGSAMDLAKLVAVLLPGTQKTADVIGIDKVAGRAVRLITVATTAGTGSEVTPIAVLTDSAEKLKKGVVSRHLIPDVAIVDPQLTVSLPPAVTAATGFDALTHCIEAYTNKFAHPVVDQWAVAGIRLLLANLYTAVTSGTQIEARVAMALGSLYGGLCLGSVNTAAVHAMAYPLGGEFGVAHGVANAVLLPFVMQFNLPACVEKYAHVAALAGIPQDSPAETLARKGILKIRELEEQCGVPSSLERLGIPRQAILAMAESCLKVKRLMDNNPRPVRFEDAVSIYNQAYEGILD